MGSAYRQGNTASITKIAIAIDIARGRFAGIALAIRRGDAMEWFYVLLQDLIKDSKTQVEAAKALGVTQSTLSSYANRHYKPTLEIAERLLTIRGGDVARAMPGWVPIEGELAQENQRLRDRLVALEAENEGLRKDRLASDIMAATVILQRLRDYPPNEQAVIRENAREALRAMGVPQERIDAADPLGNPAPAARRR